FTFPRAFFLSLGAHLPTPAPSGWESGQLADSSSLSTTPAAPGDANNPMRIWPRRRMHATTTTFQHFP
ncbi:MAG TPA: hypothetical protein VMX16_13855, partial [Terriglobia bacterium]|nr:hypothetical protein [Terriglobia bacterium]